MLVCSPFRGLIMGNPLVSNISLGYLHFPFRNNKIFFLYSFSLEGKLKMLEKLVILFIRVFAVNSFNSGNSKASFLLFRETMRGAKKSPHMTVCCSACSFIHLVLRCLIFS